jgi:hypothetical protein
VCEHASFSFWQNPIKDFAWTPATLAKRVFQLRYTMPRRAERGVLQLRLRTFHNPGRQYGKPPIVPSTTATAIGPFLPFAVTQRYA